MTSARFRMKICAGVWSTKRKAPNVADLGLEATPRPPYSSAMPYRWSETQDTQALTLWPHQSMTANGFATFIGGTALMLLMPLLAVLGSPVLWVLLLFLIAAMWAIWYAIMRNKADRQIAEELTLAGDSVHLAHRPARGPIKEWTANPDWVRGALHADGPVENYLTLKGGDREVEIGAFLTPEERADLYNDLVRAFASAR